MSAKNRWNLPILIAIALLAAGLVGAAEDLTVTVSGEAAGEGTAAKEKAVEDALRNAVEKGFGVYVDSATLSENAALVSDDIVAQARGFVRSYDVIDTVQKDGICRVTVRAVLALDKVWESDSLQLLLKRMEAPRFSVRSKESIADGGAALKGSPARDKMIEVLVDKGFVLIDGSRGAEDPVQFTMEIEAQAVFDHKSDSQGLELFFFAGQVGAKAIQSDTGKIAAAAMGSSMRGARTPEDAGRDALAFASAKAGDELVRGLLKSWAETLNAGRDIDLEVTGIRAADMNTLVEAMKSIDGIRDVIPRGFEAGKARLAVRSKRRTTELAAVLEETAALKLQVTRITANRIEAARTK